LVSIAGRRELIKSVITAQPVYLMTVIKPPMRFIKEIDKLRRHFLWAGHGELTGGKCKVAWPTVCQPTENGGLGIKDLECFSRSLRLRWLWFAWDSRERPWKDLQIPVDSEDMQLFNAATKVELGNGRKAVFWTSRWLQGDAPAVLYPALYKHSKRKNRSVLDAMTQNRWIRDIDYNMTQQLIAEFIDLWQRVHDVVLVESQEDRIVWMHTGDGQYSAKSAYDLQMEGATRCKTAKLTWKTKAPPKCKFFLWLLMQGRIWMAARLQLRGWPNEYFCQLCIRNLETAAHLFMECCVVKSIWERVAYWVRAPNLAPGNWAHTDNLQEWVLNMADVQPKTVKEGIKSLLMLVIWEIWRERNSRVFRKTSRSVQQIFSSVQDEARTWAHAGNKGLQLLLATRTQGNVLGQQAGHSAVVVIPSM
jgi:hypothetical protein